HILKIPPAIIRGRPPQSAAGESPVIQRWQRRHFRGKRPAADVGPSRLLPTANSSPAASAAEAAAPAASRRVPARYTIRSNPSAHLLPPCGFLRCWPDDLAPRVDRWVAFRDHQLTA